MNKPSADQLRELQGIVGSSSRLASALGVPFAGGVGSVIDLLLTRARVNAYAKPEEVIQALKKAEEQAAREEQTEIDRGKAALERARQEGR